MERKTAEREKARSSQMAHIASNHTGNAALCAILIMIMLLAIGTAALVVTGRSSIEENQHMPEKTIAISSEAVESQAAEDTSSIEEPKALLEYPEKDFDFMDMTVADVSAKYSVLLDTDNNKIYTGKDYSKKAYPASLTKIMTVIVALEHTKDLNDKYKFTKADIKSLQDENASVAGFKAGEKVTIEDLLYGAMLPSGADATLGLANYVAGSEEEFVKLMNQKVEELGLTGTHFTNASGLHNKQHYSTALDMAMITQYGLTNEAISKEFIKIISAVDHTTKKSNKNEDGIPLTSIFFQRYDGFFIDRDADGESDATIVGGKTGFTDESKYSLASVYLVDDIYYVCVTLKSSDAGAATQDNIAIAEKYLPTYDLIGSTNSDASSTDSGTKNEDGKAVDVTPEVIDQTESDTGSGEVTSSAGPEDQTEPQDQTESQATDAAVS